MTNLDIRRRLYNQQLTTRQAPLETANELVGWLGAVQAQDYPGAKWALGQRLANTTDAALDKAFAEGAILRTHVLRPTWHFVTPADIGWLLKLTAPRVNALNASMYRKLGLDKTILEQGQRIFARELAGGKELTRAELAQALEAVGIDCTDLVRLSLIMMYAELSGLICSGALQGKQHTYALLEERVPAGVAKNLSGEEALAELARRYLKSHGPATLQDYVWWSGLTVAEAKAGFGLIKNEFAQETLNGQTYWFTDMALPAAVAQTTPHVRLLPNYDEYIVGYTDRAAIFDPTHNKHLDARVNPLFNHTVLVNGQIAGTWKRGAKKSLAEIELHLFATLTEPEMNALNNAAQTYSDFLGLPLKLKL